MRELNEKKIKKKNVNFKAFFTLSFHLLYRQFNYFSPLKYLLFHKKENFKYVRGCPFKKNTWSDRKENDKLFIETEW